MNPALKTKISKHQNGNCALSGELLETGQAFNDADRIVPKTGNGTYADGNVRIVTPRAHMERHGTLREREEALENLKSIFDERVQAMKLKMKIQNQLLAYQRRTDHLNPDTEAFLIQSQEPIDERLNQIDRRLTALIKTYPDSLVQKALSVMSVGPVTVAALTVYIDLEKASTPSALWKYTGLHTSAGDRYSKGVASGGNKTLRTILWNTANGMMKNRLSGYRLIYDRVKLRLSASEKIVKTRNTQGKLIEATWKNAKPSHRHGAALRAIMKQFLADYWLIGRGIKGLPITTPYVEGILGHTDITTPQSRGW